MTFYPMLCESAPPTEDTLNALSLNHTFERKYDGIRAVLAINNGQVTITNRNGVNISHRYPELVEAASKVKGRVIFDGEILAWDGATRDWSFKLAHQRDAQSNTNTIKALATQHPATFMAFDVLYSEFDVRNLPYRERRPILMQAIVAAREPNAGYFWISAVPTYSTGMAAFTDALHMGWEGIVAKHNDSTYKSGRSSAWKKIKPTQSGSFVVLGLEPGNGSRADTFGAAYIGLYDNGQFKYVGKVGSGFKQVDLELLKEKWDAVAEGADPPVIEVAYQEVTDTGALRFPVFKGIRTDIPYTDCTQP